MAETFSKAVERIIGPSLRSKGFVLDAIDDAADEGGGRMASLVYYRAADCRLQELTATSRSPTWPW